MRTGQQAGTGCLVVECSPSNLITADTRSLRTSLPGPNFAGDVDPGTCATAHPGSIIEPAHKAGSPHRYSTGWMESWVRWLGCAGGSRSPRSTKNSSASTYND